MGYNTTFKGHLGFKVEPTAKQLSALKAMFTEDCREHPEWEQPGGKKPSYIDLELLDDFSGVQHNGSEKTYYMEELVNVVIREMRKQWPDFGFTGELLAQGEDIEDRWRLVIDENGWATHVAAPMAGKRIKCPHCDESFYPVED